MYRDRFNRHPLHRPGFRPQGFVEPNRDSPQHDRLVAWYPWFSGGDAIDFSPGRLNTAAVGTTPSYANDAEFGAVGDFTASTDKYQKQNFTGVSGYPYSLSCWFVADAPSSSTFQASFSVGADANKQATIYVQNGNVRAIYQNTGFQANIGPAISAGDWHHEVYVLESSTARHLYVDGAFVNTATNSLATFSPNRLEIGDLVYEPFPFNGRIADARVYTRVLTASDARHMYDPSTRWDLYMPRRRIWSFAPQAAAGAFDTPILGSGLVGVLGG